jgi:hypothetical protein
MVRINTTLVPSARLGLTLYMQAKKENILDFTAYMNKEIVVKFIGGREGTIECAHFIYRCLCWLIIDSTKLKF